MQILATGVHWIIFTLLRVLGVGQDYEQHVRPFHYTQTSFVQRPFTRGRRNKVQPWKMEAIGCYYFSKPVQERRNELVLLTFKALHISPSSPQPIGPTNLLGHFFLSSRLDLEKFVSKTGQNERSPGSRNATGPHGLAYPVVSSDNILLN